MTSSFFCFSRWVLVIVMMLVGGRAVRALSADDVLLCNGGSPLNAGLIDEVLARYPAVAQGADVEKYVQDSLSGLNARIPAIRAPQFIKTQPKYPAAVPDNLYVDYALVADPSLYGTAFGSLNGRTTLWTTFGLSSADLQSNATLTAACTPSSALSASAVCGLNPNSNNDKYDEDRVLFRPTWLAGAAMGVDRSTLLRVQQSLAPDLTFDDGLALQAASPDGNLVRTTMPGSRDAVWGFVLKGCALPVVTLRMRWLRQLQPIQGGSVTQDTALIVTNPADKTPAAVCWTRRVTLLRVAETPMTGQATAMLCSLRLLDSNTLRARLANPAYGSTADARRTAALAYVRQQNWATSADGALRVPVPEAYAQTLLACAQPDGEGTNLLGGTWIGFSTGTVGTPAAPGLPGQPGMCVACVDNGGGALLLLQNNNQQVRACNRSLAAERTVDCCVGCLPGYMSVTLTSASTTTTATTTCVAQCQRGFQFQSATGYCTACPSNTFSLGGAAVCQTCQALGYGPNAYVDASRAGCVACGARAALQPASNGAGASCAACAAGQYVPAGSSFCTGCALGQYVPPQGTACTACPSGTYMDVRNPSVCVRCPAGAYSSLSGGGATACRLCTNGTFSTANRSACLPCPPINATRFPFVEYFEAGCNVRCRPGVAFLRTNVYADGGCGNCSTVAISVGAYQVPLIHCLAILFYVCGFVLTHICLCRSKDRADCKVARHCTNAPPNARYVSASPLVGVSACRWACNAGFQPNGTAGCMPCVYTSGFFNASIHRPTTGCLYTCKPLLYVDAALRCNQTCRDLLADYRGGRLLAARVRDYVGPVSLPSSSSAGGSVEAVVRPRPRYVLGVCGSNEALRGSDLPVLRRGRWAYLGPAVPAPQACGNALLDVGEACDDGNTASGDGCSAACTVELDRYWDCDVIGAPCLPNCGWQPSATQAWQVSLGGRYVLPPCSGNGGGCACANLSNYDVAQLAPAERSAWMAAHLVPCDCGGNVQRTVPYANCTAANRGCRLCPAGQYHDDARGACAPCGGACAAGYASELSVNAYVGKPFSACGPTVSTSTVFLALSTHNLTADAGQLAVGCVPCLPPTNGAKQIRYTSGCAYACRRDPLNASYDTYCTSGQLSAVDGSCVVGLCASCALRLAALLLTSPPGAGYYPNGCQVLVAASSLQTNTEVMLMMLRGRTARGTFGARATRRRSRPTPSGAARRRRPARAARARGCARRGRWAGTGGAWRALRCRPAIPPPPLWRGWLLAAWRGRCCATARRCPGTCRRMRRASRARARCSTPFRRGRRTPPTSPSAAPTARTASRFCRLRRRRQAIVAVVASGTASCAPGWRARWASGTCRARGGPTPRASRARSSPGRRSRRTRSL